MLFIKGVKARTLWILTGVMFLIALGLIISLAYIPTEMTSTFVVLLVICFVLMTILIQWASFKTFKYKPKKTPSNPKEFETELNIEEVLKKDKYKERKRNYGISYLKIDKPNAFKISVITNSEAYFNPEEQDTTEGDKELDKCDRMIAFEIFLDYKEEEIDKMVDYSIQGKNIYYTAYYLKDNKYICPNYIKPLENHEINYNRLMEELGLKEVVKNMGD